MIKSETNMLVSLSLRDKTSMVNKSISTIILCFRDKVLTKVVKKSIIVSM